MKRPNPEKIFSTDENPTVHREAFGFEFNQLSMIGITFAAFAHTILSKKNSKTITIPYSVWESVIK